MRQSYIGSFLSVILILLSGCIPYQKIVKSEFPQGKRETKNRKIIKIIGRNLRNKKILDEYSTDIEIDALWMADEVRELYVDMLMRKEALDDEAAIDLLTSHLDKNDKALSFYVLAYTPESHRSDLHDKNPFWSLYLKMPDGKKRRPKSIKLLDDNEKFDPIIKEMFGHRFTEYKKIFLVTFQVAAISFDDLNDNNLKMDLVVRSTKTKDRLVWDLGQEESQEYTLEDYYWIEYL